MIVGTAFCPHPPALLPELGLGVEAELDELRGACTEVVRQLIAAPAELLVLIGGGSASAFYRRISGAGLAGYGPGHRFDARAVGSTAADGHGGLPLSLAIGAWLIANANGESSERDYPNVVGFSVGRDFGGSRFATELADLVQSRTVTLLVLGDGTARRSERAPGYFDDRAASFDVEVIESLRSGRAADLASLDQSLGDELLAAGVAAWRVAGALLAGADHEAQVLYVGDPFGVEYFVAYWAPRRADVLVTRPSIHVGG